MEGCDALNAWVVSAFHPVIPRLRLINSLKRSGDGMRTLAVGNLILEVCGQPALASPLPCGTSLIEFADRFDQSQLQKNGPLLEQMVAEDLVFITGSGERKGKREFIAGGTDPETTYNPIVLSDRVTIPLGPTAAVVSPQTTLSGTFGWQ